jgi:hypothetical protein
MELVMPDNLRKFTHAGMATEIDRSNLILTTVANQLSKSEVRNLKACEDQLTDAIGYLEAQMIGTYLLQALLYVEKGDNAQATPALIKARELGIAALARVKNTNRSLSLPFTRADLLQAIATVSYQIEIMRMPSMRDLLNI